jgi:hypothetical protein
MSKNSGASKRTEQHVPAMHAAMPVFWASFLEVPLLRGILRLLRWTDRWTDRVVSLEPPRRGGCLDGWLNLLDRARLVIYRERWIGLATALLLVLAGAGAIAPSTAWALWWGVALYCVVLKVVRVGPRDVR